MLRDNADGFQAKALCPLEEVHHKVSQIITNDYCKTELDKLAMVTSMVCPAF